LTRVNGIDRDGYRIEIGGGQIRVEASADPGFQYAGATLARLAIEHPAGLPPFQITDAPAYAVRGVMLDISRNKVPTMATLFDLVDRLAAWRFNHLQLYTEHTFAYRNHEAVWRDASPMTAEEIRTLDAHCAARGIELAPNQNSFGHLAEWLQHPAYRHLAEAPDGYTTPWGEKRTGPFSLNPLHPGSLALLEEWYDELLPNFTSRRFNIGGDETFDLGQGASAAACAERGKGRVYLDFLCAVHDRVSARGRHMLFWADIVLNHPEVLPDLPRDATALVWGYESDHPFDAQCRELAASDLPFWVCPGTSTWNSITGRIDNALDNLDHAGALGCRHGADGLMVCEWGDNGHWQTAPFTRLAFAAAAYTAWHGHAPSSDELARAVPHGATIMELGRVTKDAGFTLHNNSPVFPLLRFRDPSATLNRWTSSALGAAHERATAAISGLTGNDLESREIRLGARMLTLALDRGRWLKAGCPAPAAAGMSRLFRELLPDFREIWLARNRTGGLSRSVAPLAERLRECEEARGG
jgi:hypothetical protein